MLHLLALHPAHKIIIGSYGATLATDRGTDTRRLVGVMERRRQGEGAMDWVIRLEKGGPLDVRVAGILAAQLEAESMHQVTDMKAGDRKSVV